MWCTSRTCRTSTGAATSSGRACLPCGTRPSPTSPSGRATDVVSGRSPSPVRGPNAGTWGGPPRRRSEPAGEWAGEGSWSEDRPGRDGVGGQGPHGHAPLGRTPEWTGREHRRGQQRPHPQGLCHLGAVPRVGVRVLLVSACAGRRVGGSGVRVGAETTAVSDPKGTPHTDIPDTSSPPLSPPPVSSALLLPPSGPWDRHPTRVSAPDPWGS